MATYKVMIEQAIDHENPENGTFLQRVFIADIRKASQDFGWTPKISVEEGIRKLFDWVRANRDLF